MKRIVLLIIMICALGSIAQSAPVRIKDLVSFDGIRTNDLIGYGLVVGLDGTGDGLRNSPFTEEIMVTLLERLGVNISDETLRPDNVAAVLVTSQLPPFARVGSKIDVVVSAIGDATSLRGGTLMMTSLNAADGQTYAIAQGSIIGSGVSVEGDAARIAEGVPTVGSIPSGATVEREVAFALSTLGTVRLALRDPDLSTAALIEQAINSHLGRTAAKMLDPGTIEFDTTLAGQASTAHAIQTIENLKVSPERKARVVVDQRSGSIIIGEEVRISTVAVSHGGLTLFVEENPIVIQPNPFAEGETIEVPRTNVDIEQEEGQGLALVSGSTSLSDVVGGLNALGVASMDMIDILKNIHAAGALHGEFIVQ